ncbi:hypothetical protein RHMOL_Rhmol09G0164000 [Rhododendron molle]|uniref:Uncharacterized protein n=1 Tax=Rhododendron molle TaxID=49168 RepID=A0ACC0MF67_RHOML|nr:hypothetical protein RHMOL_Rhmol09G0164000 [Rhododendron molle]
MLLGPRRVFWKEEGYWRRVLGVKDVLARRKLVSDVLCPVCKEDKESVLHLIARCPFAQIVWRMSLLGVNIEFVLTDSMMDLWDNLLERWKGMREDKGVWAAVGAIIWKI